ncbi:MAG: PAS domain S-box protein [Spirochaetes bacterium]|jgi:PAS domain S-box-containing protein|nr:PAS domain S-box protein [Spirochaetota bacterium]
MIKKPTYDELQNEVNRLKGELNLTVHSGAEVSLPSFNHKSWLLMAQNTSLNIAFLDIDGAITYANKKLFQYELEDIIGKKFADFVSTRYKEDVENKISIVLEAGTLQSFDIDITLYNTENHYRGKVTPLIDMNDIIEGAIITVEDVSAQVFVEKELRDMEEQLLTLLNSSPDIISFKDSEGRWGLTNDAAEKYLQLSDVDYVMKTDQQIAQISPFFCNFYFQNSLSDSQTWNEGVPTISEEVLADPDDPEKMLVFEIIKTPLFNSDGSRRGLIINGRNVTSRKKTEEMLIESEARFKGAFLNSNVGIAILSIDGLLLDVNLAFCQLLGYTKFELINTDFHSYIHINERKDIQDNFIKLSSGDVSGYQLETKFFQAGKKPIWITLNMAMIFDTRKKPLYAVAQVLDITGKKQSETMLRESEYRYRLLANASEEAIFITEQGVCLDANDRASELFDYTYDEFIGTFIGHLVAPEWRDSVGECFVSEKEQSFEIVARKKNGTTFLALFQIKMYVYKGKVASLTLCRDLTQQKNYEKELIEAKNRAEQSDRLKSAFLANMSHEIRTPMNGIVGFSQILKDEKLSPKRRNNIVDIINRSSQHLLRIVNDIIDISKIETNQTALSNSTFNVNDVVDELYAFYEPLCKNKGIHLQVEGPKETITIIADRTKLHQILDNLITNSIKYTSEGLIKISYFIKDQIISFSVTDTGVGIPDSDKSTIFNRFIQADNQQHTNIGGTGLGLSISKAYAELMGGNLVFESTVDKGTSFTCTIPFKKGEISETELVKKTEEGVTYVFPESTKILIVEDEEINYLYLKMILDREELLHIRTASGNEAVQICKEDEEIDLVLMDIKLPDIDGFTASSRIKQFRKNLPIIAQSAYAMQDERTQALQSHFDDYITKPINSRELLTSLKFYLNKSVSGN